jgi:hypothetical protein
VNPSSRHEFDIADLRLVTGLLHRGPHPPRALLPVGRTGIRAFDGHRDQDLRRDRGSGSQTCFGDVPTGVEWACLTASTNGCEPFEKSS